MSLVGFRANNHPQQTSVRGPRPEIDDRGTPPEIFDELHKQFRFTIDVAALPHNAKLPRFYTPEDDGLEKSWAGERVWCNPPYSDIWPWVATANNNWVLENGPECIVMLVPANRTEQRWWQWGVEPYRDGRIAGYGLRVEFLPGRPRFIAHNKGSVEPNERPPFGVCLLIWERVNDPHP